MYYSRELPSRQIHVLNQEIIRTVCKISSKLTMRLQDGVIDVILVFIISDEKFHDIVFSDFIFFSFKYVFFCLYFNVSFNIFNSAATKGRSMLKAK